MAKPDIQPMYITASGTAFRLDGKLGLDDDGPITGKNLGALDFTSDVAAASGGVEVGELYHASGAVKIRRT